MSLPAIMLQSSENHGRNNPQGDFGCPTKLHFVPQTV